jgi:D-alanine-D-alanine ligase
MTKTLRFPIDKNDFSTSVNGTKITFDCVFNAIHGTPYEQLMQAYFELIGMPQSSCTIIIKAALTFNKQVCFRS